MPAKHTYYTHAGRHGYTRESIEKSNSFAHLLAAERKMYRTCSCSVRHVPLIYLQGKERKMPVRVKVSGSGSWDMREFWP